MAIKKFGIIGYGAFGELMAQLLSQHASVWAASRRHIPSYDLPKNVSIRSLEEVATCDVIILCNELAVLEENCKLLVPLVKPDTIVMDVCSVKLLPAEIMKQTLGNRCRILATHPLFGPQSIKNLDTRGQKMVWHDVSGGPFKELEAFFTNKLGLQIIKMSPEEHDKQMAWVHGLTFFIGRGLMELNPVDSVLSTNYYRRLKSVVDLERHHRYELFRSIQVGNIYAGQVRKELLRILQELDKKLEKDHV